MARKKQDRDDTKYVPSEIDPVDNNKIHRRRGKRVASPQVETLRTEPRMTKRQKAVQVSQQAKICSSVRVRGKDESPMHLSVHSRKRDIKTDRKAKARETESIRQTADIREIPLSDRFSTVVLPKGDKNSKKDMHLWLANI